MPQTIGAGTRGHTTFDLTAFPNDGSIPVLQVMRDLRKAEAALEPRTTPFLRSVGYGGTVNQEKHEWARRAWTPLASAVAGAYASGATTLNVATGEGKYFAKYHVLQIDDEIFWVTGVPTADAVPVVGGQGTSTPAAHAAAARVYIIGSAMPQLEPYALSPFSWGDQYFNYPQRFSGAHKHDRRAAVTPNYELAGNQHDARVKDELETQRLMLEHTLFRGRRQAGNPTAGSVRPSLMGGIKEFVGNTYTKTGLFSIYHFEEVGIDLDDKIGENAPNQILMNTKAWAIISRLMNPRRDADMSTTSATLVWRSVEFVTGRYTFMTSRNVPDGEIWLLNTKDLKVRPYQSLGWHERELPSDGEYLWTGVGMDATFEALSPKAMARIIGWDSALASYGAYAL